MQVSKLAVGVIALCLALICLAGCESFFDDMIGTSPPAGPKLRVVPPETIVGGQPSRWVFNWTKGAGAPYDISVWIGTGYENQFHWVESDISGSTIEHEFILPNNGTVPLTYTGNATISDRVGYTGGWVELFEAYDGTDYVVFEVVVLPAP